MITKHTKGRLIVVTDNTEICELIKEENKGLPEAYTTTVWFAGANSETDARNAAVCMCRELEGDWIAVRTANKFPWTVQPT